MQINELLCRDLQSKSMDWFLYDRVLRYERVKIVLLKHAICKYLKGLQRELSHVNMIFFSFQGYSDIKESPLLADFDIRYSSETWRHNFSSQVYPAPFQ